MITSTQLLSSENRLLWWRHHVCRPKLSTIIIRTKVSWLIASQDYSDDSLETISSSHISLVTTSCQSNTALITYLSKPHCYHFFNVNIVYYQICPDKQQRKSPNQNKKSKQCSGFSGKLIKSFQELLQILNIVADNSKILLNSVE